jgi:nitrate reductase beta subunit
MRVSRDPFSRTEIHRELEYCCGNETCSFCGNVKVTKGGRRYLYAYRVETDGGRRAPIAGKFCSISCLRAYY